jgi:prefoldin beta subunit
MGELDNQTQENIQTLRSYEQIVHNLLMQKQAFQIELNETESALSEIIDAENDIFKLIGNIMIKTDKKQTESELKKKQELLKLRLKSIESQELQLEKQIEKLREEIMKKINDK